MSKSSIIHKLNQEGKIMFTPKERRYIIKRLEERDENIEKYDQTISADSSEAMKSLRWIGDIEIGEKYGISPLRWSERYQCAYEDLRDIILKTQATEKELDELKPYKEMILCLQEILDFTPEDIRDIATFTYQEIYEIAYNKKLCKGAEKQ